MSKSQDRKLKTAQAARRMNLSESAVAELCKAGKLPGARKHRDRWLIPESAIAAWLRKQPRKPVRDALQRWERFRNKPWIFWPGLIITGVGGLVLFFFAAISAGADFGPLQEQLYQWEVIRRFAPRKEDQVLIVIAAFDTGNDQVSGIQEDLWSAIDIEIEQLQLSNTRVEQDPTIIPANDVQRARELGEYHNATIIIWGSDTDFRIQVEFLNLVLPEDPLGRQTILEEERTRLASPPEYDAFVSNDVRPLMQFLSLYGVGRAHCCTGDSDTASKVLERALEAFPNNQGDAFEADTSHVWVWLGNAYRGLQRKTDSIDAYTQAIAIQPNLATAYNNRGGTYQELGQYEEALVDMNEAIRIEPVFALHLHNRGVIYNDLKRFEEALADFNEAIRLDPSDAQIYTSRAFTYNRLGQYQQAIADATEAIKLDPELLMAYNERGFAYDNLGNYKQGIANYTAIIRRNPNQVSAHTNRSHAYHELGEYDRAIQDSSIAIRLNPENVIGYRTRGPSYAMLGEYERAIEDLNKAIALDPGSPADYRHRGYAYYQLDQYEAARKDIIRYLELAPNAPDRSIFEGFIDDIDAQLSQ